VIPSQQNLESPLNSTKHPLGVYLAWMLFRVRRCSLRGHGVERQRIEAALERIEDGNFGYYIVCDEDIAIKRLENDPSVPNCIDCQRHT